MAKKGTFSGYQTQPQVQSGFAAESSYARMAARNFTRQQEERARQQKLVEASQEAMTNALLAADVNPMEYGEKMQEGLYKVLDTYTDDLETAMERAEANPSFENTLAIKKLQNKFQNNLSTIKGIGNTMAAMRTDRDKYDAVGSLPAYNGLTKFTLGLNDMIDNMDSRDLSVNGVPISQIFSDMVPVSSLVPTIDEGAFIQDFTKGSIKQPTEVTDKNEYTGKTTVKQVANEYDVKESRYLFNQMSNNNPQAYDKIAFQVLNNRNFITDAEELKEYDLKYVNTDSKGNMYVTRDGVFNYLTDTYVEPERQILEQDKTEILKPKETRTTTYEQKKIDQAQEDALRMQSINDFVAGELGNSWFPETEQRFNISGQKAAAVNAMRMYNPITGETKYTLNYYTLDPVTGQPQKELGLKSYELSDEQPAQELASTLYGYDFDTYARTTPSFAVKGAKKMTLQDRSSSIEVAVKGSQEQLSKNAQGVSNVEQFQSEVLKDEDARAFINTLPPSVADKIRNMVSDPFTTGDSDDSLVELGESNGKAIRYDLAVGDSKDQLMYKISLMAKAGEQAVANGENPSTVMEEIANMENPVYILDPVQRYINSMPSDKQSEAKVTAERMIANNATDKEVLDALKSGTKPKSEDGKKLPPDGVYVINQDGNTYNWNETTGEYE